MIAILMYIAIGGLLGFAASRLSKSRKWIGDVAVGIGASFLGGWIASLTPYCEGGMLVASLAGAVGAALCAALLLFVAKLP